MRKIVLVSAVVLALMMLVTMVPVPARTEAAPEVRSLAFNALRARLMF